MPPLLILRPEPGNAATIAKAKALGLDVISLPLFNAEALAWSAPSADQFDALLFTSANAVRLAGPSLTHYVGLPAYCVGQATADAAKSLGFPIAFVGSQDGNDVVAAAENKKLLHLCGEDRIATNPSKATVNPIICYRMSEVDLTPKLSDALEQNPIAMLHSPRAARRFSALVSDKSKIALCALSLAIAEAAGEGWEDVAISPQPRDDVAIRTAIDHFNLRSTQGRLND
jgi:uroporphyrinogen-III synthase